MRKKEKMLKSFNYVKTELFVNCGRTYILNDFTFQGQSNVHYFNDMFIV